MTTPDNVVFVVPGGTQQGDISLDNLVSIIFCYGNMAYPPNSLWQDYLWPKGLYGWPYVIGSKEAHAVFARLVR